MDICTTFKVHLMKMKKKIRKLIISDRNNCNVLALLIVESYFRPFNFRIIEYLYWLLTNNKETSIGIAQVKAKKLSENDFTLLERFIHMFYLEKLKFNYDFLYQWITEDILLSNNPKAICRYYNGSNTTPAYISFFIFARIEVEKMFE